MISFNRYINESNKRVKHNSFYYEIIFEKNSDKLTKDFISDLKKENISIEFGRNNSLKMPVARIYGDDKNKIEEFLENHMYCKYEWKRYDI